MGLFGRTPEKTPKDMVTNHFILGQFLHCIRQTTFDIHNFMPLGNRMVAKT